MDEEFLEEVRRLKARSGGYLSISFIQRSLKVPYLKAERAYRAVSHSGEQLELFGEYQVLENKNLTPDLRAHIIGNIKEVPKLTVNFELIKERKKKLGLSNIALWERMKEEGWTMSYSAMLQQISKHRIRPLDEPTTTILCKVLGIKRADVHINKDS